MGMTILQAKQKLHENWMFLTTCGRDTELTQALSIAETVLGNYDSTLKADLEAILVDLQFEINEIPINKDNSEPFRLGQANAYDKCENLIQEKINELKGENKHE